MLQFVPIMILKKVMICYLLLMPIALAMKANNSCAPSSSQPEDNCMFPTDEICRYLFSKCQEISSKDAVTITCQGNISQPTCTLCTTATGQKTITLIYQKDSCLLSCEECNCSLTSTGPTPTSSVIIGSSSLQPITVSGEPKVSQKFFYWPIKCTPISVDWIDNDTLTGQSHFTPQPSKVLKSGNTCRFSCMLF